MPVYMFQESYTNEAWAVQIKNPQNRMEVARQIIEAYKLGSIKRLHQVVTAESDRVELHVESDTRGVLSWSGSFSGGCDEIRIDNFGLIPQ